MGKPLTNRPMSLVASFYYIPITYYNWLHFSNFAVATPNLLLLKHHQANNFGVNRVVLICRDNLEFGIIKNCFNKKPNSDSFK